LKYALSNIRLPWLIFTLLVFAGLVKLGFWQIDRAVQKEQRLNKIAQLSQIKPISLVDIQQLPFTDINDLPVKFEGEFEKEVVFLLDNQTNHGHLGYRVYQVLNVNNSALLVNLGWVLGSINRAEYPKIKALTGTHQITGHIRLIEKGILLMEDKFTHVSWPMRIQQVDVNKLSVMLNKPLLAFAVYVDKDSPLGYEKNWQPIVMPPEKHRAYAFQWFSLAIAWLLLMFWASIKFSKLAQISNNSSNKNKS